MAQHTVYAVASGKGGVGKTATTVNLGAALAEAGHTVAIVDADLGMANLGGFLGIDDDGPTLHEVLAGEAPLEDAVYDVADGLVVVPSGISLEGFANVETAALSEAVAALEEAFDYVILDLGAGLSHDTVLPLALSDAVILVSTPDRLALQDTAKTREITRRLGGAVGGVVLTRSTDPHGLDLDAISERLDLPVLAVIPEDPEIRTSAEAGRPVVGADDGVAAAGYRGLAEIVLEESLANAPHIPDLPAPIERPSAVGSDDADDGSDDATADAEADDVSEAAGSEEAAATPADAAEDATPAGGEAGGADGSTAETATDDAPSPDAPAADATTDDAPAAATSSASEIAAAIEEASDGGTAAAAADEGSPAETAADAPDVTAADESRDSTATDDSPEVADAEPPSTATAAADEADQTADAAGEGEALSFEDTPETSAIDISGGSGLRFELSEGDGPPSGGESSGQDGGTGDGGEADDADGADTAAASGAADETISFGGSAAGADEATAASGGDAAASGAGEPNASSAGESDAAEAPGADDEDADEEGAAFHVEGAEPGTDDDEERSGGFLSRLFG